MRHVEEYRCTMYSGGRCLLAHHCLPNFQLACMRNRASRTRMGKWEWEWGFCRVSVVVPCAVCSVHACRARARAANHRRPAAAVRVA